MTRARLLDRARGCLVGLGVGDALGATLEFTRAAGVAARPGPHTEMTGGGPFNLAPGEVTDDTQMAIALAESLLEHGRFDAVAVAAKYAQWLSAGPKDVGDIVQSALFQLRGGARPPEAALRVHELFGGRTAGNGALMRCAPLALLYRDDPAALANASMAEARVTHWDEVVGLSSIYLNLSIAAFLRGLSADDALEAADAAVHGRDNRLDECLYMIKHRQSTPLAPSAYVIATLFAAYSAFRSTASFEEALVAVVNLGGDSDTTGAVTGALAGAFYGLREIPPRWLAVLQPRQRLEDLASTLAQTQPAPPL